MTAPNPLSGNARSALTDVALAAAAGVDWFATLAALTVFAAVMLGVGVVVGVLIRRRRSTPPAPIAPPPISRGGDVVAQRAALVGGCLKVRGLLDDPLLADVLDDALRAAGISVSDPTGQRCDPARHRIDHTVPAPDAPHDGVIAQTLTPAYTDGAVLLRPADVVVFKAGRS